MKIPEFVGFQTILIIDQKIFFKFLKISILWPLTFYSDPAWDFAKNFGFSEYMNFNIFKIYIFLTESKNNKFEESWKEKVQIEIVETVHHMDYRIPNFKKYLCNIMVSNQILWNIFCTKYFLNNFVKHYWYVFVKSINCIFFTLISCCAYY